MLDLGLFRKAVACAIMAMAAGIIVPAPVRAAASKSTATATHTQAQPNYFNSVTLGHQEFRPTSNPTTWVQSNLQGAKSPSRAASNTPYTPLASTAVRPATNVDSYLSSSVRSLPLNTGGRSLAVANSTPSVATGPSSARVVGSVAAYTKAGVSHTAAYAASLPAVQCLGSASCVRTAASVAPSQIAPAIGGLATGIVHGAASTPRGAIALGRIPQNAESYVIDHPTSAALAINHTLVNPGSSSVAAAQGIASLSVRAFGQAATATDHAVRSTDARTIARPFGNVVGSAIAGEGAGRATSAIGDALASGARTTDAIASSLPNVRPFIRSSEDIKEVIVSRAKHPEAAQHILDAQAAGQPDVLTIDRSVAPANRSASTNGPTGIPGKDLDEYPPAMFKEGGSRASVRAISMSDNRGAGASIGNQLRGLPDGTKIRIVVR